MKKLVQVFLISFLSFLVGIMWGGYSASRSCVCLCEHLMDKSPEEIVEVNSSNKSIPGEGFSPFDIFFKTSFAQEAKLLHAAELQMQHEEKQLSRFFQNYQAKLDPKCEMVLSKQEQVQDSVGKTHIAEDRERELRRFLPLTNYVQNLSVPNHQVQWVLVVHFTGNHEKYLSVRNTWFRSRSPDLGLIGFGAVRPKYWDDSLFFCLVGNHALDYLKTLQGLHCARLLFPKARFMTKADDDTYLYTSHVAHTILHDPNYHSGVLGKTYWVTYPSPFVTLFGESSTNITAHNKYVFPQGGASYTMTRSIVDQLFECPLRSTIMFEDHFIGLCLTYMNKGDFSMQADQDNGRYAEGLPPDYVDKTDRHVKHLMRDSVDLISVHKVTDHSLFDDEYNYYDPDRKQRSRNSLPDRAYLLDPSSSRCSQAKIGKLVESYRSPGFFLAPNVTCLRPLGLLREYLFNKYQNLLHVHGFALMDSFNASRVLAFVMYRGSLADLLARGYIRREVKKDPPVIMCLESLVALLPPKYLLKVTLTPNEFIAHVK